MPILGTAFTCPAGPEFQQQHLKFTPHLTLAFINTQDEKIISATRYFIDRYTKHYFESRRIKKTSKHYALTHNSGALKVNSIFFENCEIADFKKQLDNHLRNHTPIGRFLGDYREAHVNVYGNPRVPIYENFYVDNIQLIKTR